MSETVAPDTQNESYHNYIEVLGGEGHIREALAASGRVGIEVIQKIVDQAVTSLMYEGGKCGGFSSIPSTHPAIRLGLLEFENGVNASGEGIVKVSQRGSSVLRMLEPNSEN